jgi:acetyltransferase-like isoleucine patch superfamily enzyme
MPRSERDDGELREATKRLDRFLAGDTADRVFRHPTVHPARGTGFCYCDRSVFAAVGMCLRGGLLELVLRLPFNRPKLWLLRGLGTRIGDHVYISAGAWIDPVYPQLLTIEDDVVIGVGARIFTHEFRRDEFVAGRVIFRRGAIIGAHSLIGCGVEIGEAATVAPGAAVARDVPAGCTAVGNPARIVRRQEGHPSDRSGV